MELTGTNVFESKVVVVITVDEMNIIADKFLSVELQTLGANQVVGDSGHTLHKMIAASWIRVDAILEVELQANHLQICAEEKLLNTL